MTSPSPVIHNAGCCFFQVNDPAGHRPIPVFVFYPTFSPEQPETIGQYTIDASSSAKIASGVFPLIAISHGSGGSPLTHRLLARFLARHGFAVVLPEHPGNNRVDNSLANTTAILTERPRHIRLILDWVFSSDGLGTRILPEAAAIIGHSLGGYTALALAGGIPVDREAHPIEVVPDSRVKALVLLAPAAAWFISPNALSGIHVPVLMMTAEKDPHTPAWNGDIVKRGIPGKSLVTHREVANAGHFSFLSPFPLAMASATFLPSQDPAGFNRPAFHEEMNEEILAFLRRVF